MLQRLRQSFNRAGAFSQGWVKFQFPKTTQPSHPQHKRGRKLQNARIRVLREAVALADAAGDFMGTGKLAIHQLERVR